MKCDIAKEYCISSHFSEMQNSLTMIFNRTRKCVYTVKFHTAVIGN
jgi:hypothetical protein